MKKQTNRSFNLTVLTMAFFMTGLMPVIPAHADAGHAKQKVAAPISDEEYAFGKQGDPNKADRTLVIDMHDTMRFGPSTINVKQGETIRFVAKNKGKVLHEMVLGTMEGLKKHGDMMKRHPGMEHDDPYMTHVSPGEKEEMIWQFTQAGEFYFGCLVPGHFEAGMVGKINVAAR